MIVKTQVPVLTLGATALFAVMACTSCGGGQDTPLVDNANVDAYYLKTLPSQPVKKSSGKASIYFDYSCIASATDAAAKKDPAKLQILETFSGIAQRITSNLSAYNIYALYDEQSYEVANIQQQELFNEILKPREDPNAPLEQTLQKIVSDGVSALLVTDYEEYHNGIIYDQAYAAKYFTDWVNKGRDIVFYVSDYDECMKGGVIAHKHLYYTVFDDGSHTLLKQVEEGLEGRPQNYKKFVLSNTAFSLSTNYGTSEKGGTYHDEEGNDAVCATAEGTGDITFTPLKAGNAEFYPFGSAWTDIYNNAKALQEEGVTKKFEHLFGNLLADFSALNAYKISSMSVRVSDVQDDFDKQMDETAKAKGKSTPVKDMLVFDQKLFEKTYGAKTELAVNLDPKFNGNIIGLSEEQQYDLLRVELVIDDAKPNFDSLDALFGRSDNHNALKESVLQAMQNCKPAGKVIYTYFIKINQ